MFVRVVGEEVVQLVTDMEHKVVEVAQLFVHDAVEVVAPLAMVQACNSHLHCLPLHTPKKKHVKLIEDGFAFVCDYNGNKIFRKRK